MDAGDMIERADEHLKKAADSSDEGNIADTIYWSAQASFAGMAAIVFKLGEVENQLIKIEKRFSAEDQ